MSSLFFCFVYCTLDDVYKRKENKRTVVLFISNRLNWNNLRPLRLMYNSHTFWLEISKIWSNLKLVLRAANYLCFRDDHVLILLSPKMAPEIFAKGIFYSFSSLIIQLKIQSKKFLKVNTSFLYKQSSQQFVFALNLMLDTNNK